jgi:phosphoribosylformylglycinamidine cyclo-ligase
MEMFRVFNMGVGMVVVVSRDRGEEISNRLAASGETSWILGEVVPGEGVSLV